MSFKIPFFNVPLQKEDNRNLFSWFAGLYGRSSGSDLVLSREVSMGDWNVHSTASITVNYKNVNTDFSFKKVRSISVIMFNDDEDTMYDSSLVRAGLESVKIDDTEITLTKITGGFFDNTDFDSTSITTRGYIMLGYVT